MVCHMFLVWDFVVAILFGLLMDVLTPALDRLPLSYYLVLAGDLH